MRGDRRVLARDHRLPRLLLLLLVLLLLLWRGDDVVVLHHDPHAGALARPGPLQPGHDVFVEADDEAARPDEDEEGQEDGHQEGVPVLGHWPRPATWPHTGRGHDGTTPGLLASSVPTLGLPMTLCALCCPRDRGRTMVTVTSLLLQCVNSARTNFQLQWHYAFKYNRYMDKKTKKSHKQCNDKVVFDQAKERKSKF